MESKEYESNCLDELQARSKTFEIIKTLEGLPLGHALFILDSAKELLLDCHTVDFDNDQFRKLFSEHAEQIMDL